MGSQVKAICKCGINKKILIGGSRASFQHTQFFPCYCGNCKDVVQGNVKKWRKRCPNCSKRVIPYYKKKLMGLIGKVEIARNFNDVLTNGTYKCPNCENYSLRFEEGDILWD